MRWREGWVQIGTPLNAARTTTSNCALIGIMPVSGVKLIMACSGIGVPQLRRCCQELADLDPGEFLVAGVTDGLGQELLGMGGEASQSVQADGGITEPVGVRSQARASIASLRTARSRTRQVAPRRAAPAP